MNSIKGLPTSASELVKPSDELLDGIAEELQMTKQPQHQIQQIGLTITLLLLRFPLAIRKRIPLVFSHQSGQIDQWITTGNIVLTQRQGKCASREPRAHPNLGLSPRSSY